MKPNSFNLSESMKCASGCEARNQNKRANGPFPLMTLPVPLIERDLSLKESWLEG
jgi:hypothetical protein